LPHRVDSTRQQLLENAKPVDQTAHSIGATLSDNRNHGHIALIATRVAAAPVKRGTSAAKLATGWEHLIGPAIASNFALFIYVLFEPLLVTRIPLISRNEIVLSKVAYDLYHTDTLLFIVVALFGIAAPTWKMLASAYFWYCIDVRFARKHHKWLVMLGKLSMLDIMLVAIVIVAIKGTGIGSVETRPGLYCYIFLILSSLLVSFAIDLLLGRYYLLLTSHQRVDGSFPGALTNVIR
jgi:paraquat-inducible protein A